MTGLTAVFIIAMALSVTGTSILIRFLITHQCGQFIRQDGSTQHLTKRGTPTMGGAVTILAIVVVWLIGSLVTGIESSWSSLLLIFLFVDLSAIGPFDDGIKTMHQRSFGLHLSGKIIGQVVVISLFVLGILIKPNEFGEYPGTLVISFMRPTATILGFAGLGLGIVLYLIWTNLIAIVWSNAINLTDGPDGLAMDVPILAFGAYMPIIYLQRIQVCMQLGANQTNCYSTCDLLDLAIFCVALTGVLAGFLWWNASPAQTLTGNIGAPALDGTVTGLSVFTQTRLLAIVIDGLLAAVVLSDIVQVSVLKATGKRVSRMAPLHHHFEPLGWKEMTIVIRFWLTAVIVAVVGVSLFCAEWMSLR